MGFKIYVVRFSDGSYYHPFEICFRKENAERLTWAEAEEIRDASNRAERKDTIVETV